MTETQRRIEAYQKALPGIREKVTAVAMLLALSVIMLTSASFAWLTISRAPEVSDVATNITANGNLEIALAIGDGTIEPYESKVGDSIAGEGQTIVAANITWGNLINLNDPSYGLGNLVLRPAQLNESNLLKSPLYGADYLTDGRIEKLTSDFGYAVWIPPKDDVPGYFGIGDDYGVRAISSIQIEAVGAEAVYLRLVKTAEEKNLEAIAAYQEIGENTEYMQSLANIMGAYMTDRMDNDGTYKNPAISVADVDNLIKMYYEFLDVIDLEVEAIAGLINVQLFLMNGENNYTEYTKEMVYEARTSAKLAQSGLVVTNLEGLLADKAKIESGLAQLEKLSSRGGEIRWGDDNMNNVINSLVNVGECQMSDGTKIKDIGASEAINYLGGAKAVITNGVLYNFELRTGGTIKVENLKIYVSAKRSFINLKDREVKTTIYTNAKENEDYTLFGNDLETTKKMNTGNYQGGIETAQDTYGLALDFWVRTNAAGSYLTLEGNVLSDSEDVPAKGKDATGKEIDLYTVMLSSTDPETGEVFSYPVDVYLAQGTIIDPEKGEVEGEYWHSAETHTILTEKDLGGKTPNRKYEKVVTILGYEGINRVWGNELLPTDSTTQGNGSCYVYYADSPEDMNRSLKLLESFKVVFVNGDGEKLATAEMDTERYFAESGRVTVPLVLLPSDSVDLGKDYLGNTSYAIMPLEQNEATRVTAIVYLDGTQLGNSDVLAASDIHGQLNIQFGSSKILEPIDNEDLSGKTLSVSASVDNIYFDYDNTIGPMTSTFKVNVSGAEPKNVTAYLIRKVSATQGSREDADPSTPGEDPLVFTKGEGGEWTCSYTFTVPGTYILRTVSLDGDDHDLNPSNLPTVTIKGFAISSFVCEQATANTVNVMTAESSTTLDLNLKFVTEDQDKMPREVQGRFLGEKGAVNADFVYNPTTGTWTAKAVFNTSGEYKIQYLVLDGKTVELDSSMWQTANVTLGMRVAVYSSSPKQFVFKDNDMAAEEKLLSMEVVIMDNAGNQLTGFTEVTLTYGMKGSGVKKMDTDLTWNGRYYVGELATTGPGIWQFNNVNIKIDGKNNTLTLATTYPTFTIQSPEPPEYVTKNTASYIFAPDNNAKMKVVISNSSAATVQAYIIRNGATEGVWVDGSIGSEYPMDDGTSANYWEFIVPTDANGYQDGHWTLTGLRLWDVFAADGTAYTQDAPLEFDVYNTNNKAKVVSRVNVSFVEDKSTAFGKDANGKVTGDFMESYTVSGISVKIYDFENQKIDGVSDVKLEFTYGCNSKDYGGYTADHITNASEDFAIILEGTGTTFSQNGSKTLQHAGSWATEFSFKINGVVRSYNYNGKGDKPVTNMPYFTVSSVTPQVKITEASYASASSETAATFTDTSTKVYAYEYTTTTTVCGANFNYKAYKQPFVTLTLSGYGKATGATLTFAASAGGNVLLYEAEEGKSSVSTYTWTGNGTCKRWVGYWNSQTGDDDRTTAGTLTATTLILTYNGVQYTVSAPITIENPN